MQHYRIVILYSSLVRKIATAHEKRTNYRDSRTDRFTILPRNPLLRAQLVHMQIRIHDTVINTPVTLHDARSHSRYTSDAINHAKYDDPCDPRYM